MENRVKPKVKLVGEDGNAFFILGRVRAALRKAGQADLIEEYTKKAKSGDYNNLLRVTMEYVDDVGEDDEDETNNEDED